MYRLRSSYGNSFGCTDLGRVQDNDFGRGDDKGVLRIVTMCQIGGFL
jgi:hypothetical protein